VGLENNEMDPSKRLVDTQRRIPASQETCGHTEKDPSNPERDLWTHREGSQRAKRLVDTQRRIPATQKETCGHTEKDPSKPETCGHKEKDPSSLETSLGQNHSGLFFTKFFILR